MKDISFYPNHTAVLGMDLQAGIVSVYTKNDKAFLSRVEEVLRSARGSGMHVIHVKVGFRPNLPEVSSRNLLFGGIKASAQWQKLFEGDLGAIHPSAAPHSGDIVLTKSRVSAFTGTDLELILRSQDIDTLVLFGIATSGVVLATLFQASDADYRLVVIKDCCLDLETAVHDALVEKVFPRQATVMTASEFLAAIKK